MATAKNKHGLTQQQELFARLVVEYGNQSAAYREAYPSSVSWQDKTVWSKASSLAAKEKVGARIAELRKVILQKHEVTADRIVQEWCRIAFADVSSCFDKEGRLLEITEMPADARRLIAGMDISQTTTGDEKELLEQSVKKIKFVSKMDALDKLARHMGMYIKKVEVSGPGEGPVQHEASVTAEDLTAAMQSIADKL